MEYLKLIWFGILLLDALNARATEDLIQPAECRQITKCPYNQESCTEDDNCNPDSICCNSPCGRICTKQLSTGCEILRKATARRAKALGVDAKKVRTPRCNKAGGFEPIQCDNEIVNSCWCVDEQGFELAGTRAPTTSLVNCTAPKLCAAHTCRMFCPHGFTLAEDGCPLCKCRDPCDDIRCPNALDCQLEELVCSDPPCPPVPTCKRGRSLDNICPVGDPLRISDTVRPFLCGIELSKPQCPPLYQCLVQTGNDYGVCCPASLKIQKAGICPETTENKECGSLCAHDLECPSIQKCCNTEQCGSSCAHPQNVTECIHQKTLSELLVVNERMGRGYIPQCNKDGLFEAKQCSRNELVCWCVDSTGIKIRGSMGAAENVTCSVVDVRTHSSGRSIDVLNKCEKLECASICEYGFKLDEEGCPTCKCDDPCEGYTCSEDEECIVVREANCSDFLCPTLPVCRPKTVYTNPCKIGSPLTDDLSGAPVPCELRLEDEIMCPKNYECTAVAGSSQSFCCPNQNESEELTVEDELSSESNYNEEAKVQTMCEYLESFGDNMEGTREGMTLALPQPLCDSEGNFSPQQCVNKDCWCVDQFGTEIPKTRGIGNSTKNCSELRESLDCLDLTCRLGCDYGFILDAETGCPSCQCRDPCSSITCNEDQQCQMVEASCKDHYCPPVPACLPNKTGQCPYLVPAITTSCDFECNSDLACNGTQRCCSNGCGTQCTEPLLMTGCQHQRAVTQHQAHESGTPAGRVYIPKCKEDGNYESSQCDPGKNECWCVDFRGFEISGSRSNISSKKDCEKQSESDNCSRLECIEDCQHGFKINDKGCRTCECIDACSSVQCRGEGESCRLVNVECVDWPCPPVPMCLPQKENPCQIGEPLKLNQNELVTCGPEYENCPSSHKCQLSPLGEYAVCCSKPRDVCFESLDKGFCSDLDSNLTRFYFNSRTNRCESFTYTGCHGNHNNFHTQEMCNIVCPVLSKCERLREKNQLTSEKYKKPTFMPRCDSSTGNWDSIQCMEHVGVCWCVNPQGEPLKGTLIRGLNPNCNFRQARSRLRDNLPASEADLILEELMLQLASIEDNEISDTEVESRTSPTLEIPVHSRCQALKAQCDNQGKFLPAQCEGDLCWCVDEAGNQLPQTSTFQKGKLICLPTPVDSVDITLGFKGVYDDISSMPIINNVNNIVKSLKGTIKNNELLAEPQANVLYIKFSIVGINKVDIAYRLEQMIMQQRLPGMTPDITQSRFIHQLGSSEPSMAERVIALEHREIVSQSPVSMIAPYHTALIVIAAASAFVICILTLLVILYRRKVASMNPTSKIIDNHQRFLSCSRPIYIELPNEKLTPPSLRPEKDKNDTLGTEA